MYPKLHPYAIEPILALAAVDYVADKITDIPPPTTLFLNMIWVYGCHPPIAPGADYDQEEVLALCWGEALYEPGMSHVLGEMRLRDQPDTPMRWFHDAVYIAALLAFRQMCWAEDEALPPEHRSGATSDIAELGDLPDAFIEACGHAIGDVDGFRTHFEEARSRFNEDMPEETAPCWPPFAGITRPWAGEWFE